MFYGEYHHSIDRKGRLIIPSKFREACKERYAEKFFTLVGRPLPQAVVEFFATYKDELTMTGIPGIFPSHTAPGLLTHTVSGFALSPGHATQTNATTPIDPNAIVPGRIK